MANDPTVKAGSWGARTVEKIVRLTEHALRHELPVVYLVDSAGARITDQVELFPGRRGAGRIFANQVRLSGKVPQVCCLFGPSAAGGAYIPAFCDVVFMVEGNASMYLGSPRMAEVVIGEHDRRSRRWAARACTPPSAAAATTSCADDDDAIDAAPALPVVPADELARSRRRRAGPAAPVDGAKPIADDRARRGAARLRHAQGGRRARRRGLVLRAQAAVGAGADHRLRPARRRCRSASSPTTRCTSAACCSSTRPTRRRASSGCATRSTCRCCSSPTCPGFMIGSQVEREGIIRHGAKMITAVAEATVPKFSVIVRKAYGAGLYAMCGPAFDPDACLALPTAQIAVMGPEPAVNAVFYNKIQAIEDADERAAFVAERRREYEEDVDLVHLAAELVVDAVVQPEDLRDELVPAARARRGPRPRRRREAPRRPAGVDAVPWCASCNKFLTPPTVTRRRHVPEVRPDRRARADPGHDPLRRRARARGPVAPEAPRPRARALPQLALLPDHRVGSSEVRLDYTHARHTGCGAVWLARSDWGSEGREFKSPQPDGVSDMTRASGPENSRRAGR